MSATARRVAPSEAGRRFAIVVPHRNGHQILRRTLIAASEACGPRDVVVVVDNASIDGSVAVLAEEFPEVLWLRNASNRGYAAACNQGAEVAPSQFLLFLNSDAVVPPDILSRLEVFFAQMPQAGEVGFRLVGANGAFQRATAPSPDLWSEFGLRRRVPKGFSDPSDAAEVDTLVGACVAITRLAFERVGGWDERFFFYEEDVDLSVRVKAAGFQIWFLPQITVTHLKGAATGSVLLSAQLEAVRSRFLYIEKHFAPGLVPVLVMARLFSMSLRTLEGWLILVVTLGLNASVRRRAVTSAITMLWVLLMMRPRWSLSGQT